MNNKGQQAGVWSPGGTEAVAEADEVDSVTRGTVRRKKRAAEGLSRDEGMTGERAEKRGKPSRENKSNAGKVSTEGKGEWGPLCQTPARLPLALVQTPLCTVPPDGETACPGEKTTGLKGRGPLNRLAVTRRTRTTVEGWGPRRASYFLS